MESVAFFFKDLVTVMPYPCLKSLDALSVLGTMEGAPLCRLLCQRCPSWLAIVDARVGG